MQYYASMIYHLDLCILAYHLYGQTLVWPMDPYYEAMAIGRVTSNRRSNFMAKVRQNLENNVFENYDNGKCRPELDPIMVDYERIDPQRPCLYRPELGQWLYFRQIQAEISDSINSVKMSKMVNLKPRQISYALQNESGNDFIYCFEGTVGLTSNKNEGQKAMLGFILDKGITDGGTFELSSADEYDVHIVFRGSRSGLAERSFIQGYNKKGNPDWVTDMQYRDVKLYTDISEKGNVSTGFALVLQSAIPCINACLDEINERRKQPPRNIYVTGHSLAGALAGLFTSAMIMGDGTHKLAKLHDWNFPKILLRTYGCPTFGDKEFAQSWKAHSIHCERWRVKNDPITTTKMSSNQHVGELKEATRASAKPSINHRFEVTRKRLIEHYKLENVVGMPQISILTTENGKMPRTLQIVKGLLQDSDITNLRISPLSGIPDKLKSDLKRFLSTFKDIDSIPDSHTKTDRPNQLTLNQRGQIIDDLIGFVDNHPVNLESVIEKIDSSKVFNKSGNFFILCFILLKISLGEPIIWDNQRVKSVIQKL